MTGSHPAMRMIQKRVNRFAEKIVRQEKEGMRP
jgi:hypothetical protein